jgi:ribonucleotide reductase beta subunit family protein with ferritin-like domain
MLHKKLDQSVVHTIIRDAVEIEKSFICDALPCALIGMNSGMMSTYIEVSRRGHSCTEQLLSMLRLSHLVLRLSLQQVCADRLLTDLGYAKIWNAVNPFEWMEVHCSMTRCSSVSYALVCSVC